MLSLAKFPTQIQYKKPLFQNPITQSLHFSSKTHLSFPLHFNFRPKLRTGFCSNALKTKKKSSFTSSETDGPDEFDDDEFFDDGEFDDEDDDEVIVPLKNMKEWLENRPRGFGEGKVYDTSIEDKLMEEIEQSRKAQLANLNKLKNNNPVAQSSKKDVKGSTNVNGFRVRLVNLPKKKNIHKDLKLAFKGVRGLLNIVPVVSGNEKTRDPVCKGLAFVDFKYQDEAQRFVENFSGKSISFGKVEKQIKCEMVSSKSPKPADDQSVDKRSPTPLQLVLNLDSDSESDVETSVALLDSLEESGSSELDDSDERYISAEFEDDEEINGTSSISDSNLAEEIEMAHEPAIDPSLSKQGRKLNTEKKAASKRKKDKTPKLNIPGSANRLKIREKEMLTGVFSKYGANAASTVKEPSR